MLKHGQEFVFEKLEYFGNLCRITAKTKSITQHSTLGSGMTWLRKVVERSSSTASENPVPEKNFQKNFSFSVDENWTTISL